VWQLRLEKTSLDRTTLNNDFAAIPSQHSTSERNTPLTKTLDLNFESAASAIPPLRRANILGHLWDRGNLRIGFLGFHESEGKWSPRLESVTSVG
jgi:hypothetical protein